MNNSPKDEFARVLERFKLVEMTMQVREEFPALDRLASDDRMQNVWNMLKGDQHRIDEFLQVSLSAMCSAPTMIEWAESNLDRAADEFRELKQGIDLVLKYCESAALPERLRNLEPALRDLESFGHAEASRKQRLFASHLRMLASPPSRKKRSDIRQRVQTAELFVRDMIKLFGKPHYQHVADTMNVFFDFPEEQEMTSSSVRDA